MSGISIQPDRDSPPQWRSTKGNLIIETCDDCNKPYYYPRGFCPFCLGQNVRWMECSGDGQIYSYSVMRRGEPYVIAYVTLAEGPTILTNIVESPVDEVAIGKPVSLAFQEHNGVDVPMFRLAGDLS